jgi:hypothetical protein
VVSGFDKFAWLRAVYNERIFTAGEKAVLAHIAVFNVLSGRDTFCVRQSTIAGQCGITRRTVSSAMGSAKRLKYLSLAHARQPGWGRNGADELRLTLPELGEDPSLDSAQSREKQTRKSCEANAESREKQTRKLCEAPNSPTCENNPPNSSLKQFSENSSWGEACDEPEPLDVEPVPDHANTPPPADSSEEKPQPLDVEEVEPDSRELVTQRTDRTDTILGEVVDDAPDPEPQPYCDRHMPNGTDNSCGPCGHRRGIREKWEQRQQARVLQGIFSQAAEPARPVRLQPPPKPEPPSWVDGPHGPRCPRHAHREVVPADCTRCQDAAITAKESA